MNELRAILEKQSDHASALEILRLVNTKRRAKLLKTQMKRVLAKDSEILQGQVSTEIEK